MAIKIPVFSIEGKKTKEIALPSFFSAPIREDLIWKYIETRKKMHPYGSFREAGKRHSASGIIRHKRHEWKISYGRGMSRVPRKILVNRGAQFIWVGAEVSGTRGGRRAHPPKPEHMINKKGINKKEAKLALLAACAATASNEKVHGKYARLDSRSKIIVPLIVESNKSLNIREFKGLMKNILGDSAEYFIPKKEVRAGKGKMRGRRYKTNAGILFVKSEKEDIRLSGIDVRNAKNISILDLAKGGPGRLTMYTENALNELEERLK
jgi:large subunit ribosomal protein L4e